MGPSRRDGRIRPSTLWVAFIVALLAGAAAGWAYRWYSHRSVSEQAERAVKDVKGAAEKATK